MITNTEKIIGREPDSRLNVSIGRATGRRSHQGKHYSLCNGTLTRRCNVAWWGGALYHTTLLTFASSYTTTPPSTPWASLVARKYKGRADRGTLFHFSWSSAELLRSKLSLPVSQVHVGKLIRLVMALNWLVRQGFWNPAWTTASTLTSLYEEIDEREPRLLNV